MSLKKLPKIARPSKKVIDYDPKSATELIRDKSVREAIIQAIEVGYIVYPSKELIWEIYKQQSDYEEETTRPRPRSTSYQLMLYQKIRYLNFQNIPIVEVGDLPICTNLRILNLSCNYVTRIDSLIVCKHLTRLDLHKNQLDTLPAGEFWSQLDQLVILYLHNNPIIKLGNLQHLTQCRKLEILTLFDTPISLSRNYRHHVVNSIVTLKVKPTKNSNFGIKIYFI